MKVFTLLLFLGLADFYAAQHKAPSPLVSDGCYDGLPINQCMSWKVRNKCDTEFRARIYCKKTCGFCEPESLSERPPFGCHNNKVALKSHFGKYVLAKPDGTANANGDRGDIWAVFTLEDVGSNRVALRSHRGKYLLAEDRRRGYAIDANGNNRGPWEIFTVEQQPGGTIALKTAHGQYVAAEQDGQLKGDRAVADVGARFSPECVEAPQTDDLDAPSRPPVTPPTASENPCAIYGGVQSGELCCAAKCGTCGGPGCSQRPGGSSNCCGSGIPKAKVCGSGRNAPCHLNNDPCNIPRQDRTCTAERDPVCGTNGKTYSNRCWFTFQKCDVPSLEIKHPGRCSRRDFCMLPPVKGPCEENMERFYFDRFSASGCKKFIYGGCGGNGNNFRSRIECLKRCRGRVPHLHVADQNQDQCADQVWAPNKEYDFEYHGRLLTGLPSLASQYSGIGMRASVKLFTKTSNTIVLKVEDPKYVDVNQVLYPKERGADISYKNEGWNWRNLYLPPLQDVPAEYKQILARPVEFVISCNGAVRKVVVSQNEPEWSINFKKALIVLFQTKVDSYNIQLEQNMIEHPSNEQSARFTWVVKEDSMQGSCENTYQVNEIPEFLIKENPELIPLPSKCASNQAQRKYFEITRTRNLHSCERKAQFNFFKPGHMNTMRNGGSDSAATPSGTSVTRSIVCASADQASFGAPSTSGIAKTLRATDIVFQRIVSENEQSENMNGFNAERFVTGTKQTLMLRNVADAANVPGISQPMELFDLMYEYDTKIMPSGLMKGGRLDNEVKDANELEGKMLSKIRPKTGLSALYGAPSSQIFVDKNEQIKKLLAEVVKEMIESEKSGATEESNKSNINMKLLSAARGFSMYENATEIKQLWAEVQQLPCIQTTTSSHYHEVMRNFFVDTVAMAGTPASIDFIAELIEEGTMTNGQILNFLMWTPHYVVYPTRPLLQTLYHTVRSEQIQRHATLRNMAITSFTQLLEQACVSEERKITYPIFVTGEFCNANSRIVKEEWLPYLLGGLASASNANERNVYLVALGALKHKDIITELIPYVSGALTTQAGQRVTSLNRLMATYSLANIGSAQPNMVIPTLMTVFSNPSESIEIRIAAFNCLLRMSPSSAIFHRIAAVTQQEPDMDYELLKTINIAFYSLGNQPSIEGLESANAELINKARVTLHLIRQVSGILPTSGTIYTADFLKKLGLGYEAFISYVSSESSILPKSMYMEVQNSIDQIYSIFPMRLGYRLNGHDNLYEGIRKNLHKGLHDAGFSSSMEAPSQGMEAQDTPIDAALIVQLFESGAFFLSGDQITSASLTEKMLPYIKNPDLLKQKLGGQMDINMQRTFNLAQMDKLVPSDMGFPINMEYHAPTTVSVVGKMTPLIDAASPKLEISGKFVYTGQFIANVGTVVPFSKGMLLTGVNQHIVVNVPGTVKLEVNIPSQKVSIMAKAHSDLTTPIDVLHTHRYPFTLTQKIFDLTPIPEQSQIKPIQSPSQLKTIENEFGDYLGLKLTSKIETESQYTDVASIFDVLKMYNNNPLNLLVFPWSIPALSERLNPSVRKQRISIMYDPAQSSTKEIGFEVKVGCATKKLGASSAKYHSLKVKSTSGSMGSESVATNSGKWLDLMKKISPYSVEEKSIGSSAVHPRREQKLKEMLDEVEAGAKATGVTLHLSGIIKGSRPRVWNTVLSFLGGIKNETYGSIKQIWDVRLEKPSGSPDSPKHLCLKGHLKAPLLPIWNTHELQIRPIDFILNNEIGMGMTSCRDASVITSGNARVSEQQKEFSRTSQEATTCMKMMQGGASAVDSHACKTANYQARTLDVIELTNRFTSVPEVVNRWEQRLTTVAKAYLWPFTRAVQRNNNVAPAHTFTTSLKIGFQKRVPAFDLMVKRPQENLWFKGVRVPYPFSLVAPLKAGPQKF